MRDKSSNRDVLKVAQLRKQLGSLDVFAVAAGAMISSGLFVLPAIAFAKAGPAVILSYLFASILIIPSVLSKAEWVRNDNPQSTLDKALCSYLALYQQGLVFNRNTNSLDKTFHILYYNPKIRLMV